MDRGCSQLDWRGVYVYTDESSAGVIDALIDRAAPLRRAQLLDRA
jgi:hypothetical protein